MFVIVGHLAARATVLSASAALIVGSLAIVAPPAKVAATHDTYVRSASTLAGSVKQVASLAGSQKALHIYHVASLAGSQSQAALHIYSDNLGA